MLEAILKYVKTDSKNIPILVLFFVLPFSAKFSNIAIALCLIWAIAEMLKSRAFPKVSLFWFLPCLFCYYVVSELLTGGDWQSIEKRLLFILLPIIVAGLIVNSNESGVKLKLYKSYIFGNLSVLMICLIRAVVRSISIREGAISFNPKVIAGTEFDFLTSSVMGGNYFFSEEFSYFLHPAYFGLHLVFAQYLVTELFTNVQTKKHKLLLVAVYFLFFLSVFMLSSKAALLGSLLLALFIGLLLKVSPYLKVGVIVGVLLLSFLFVQFNPKLKVFTDTFKEGLVINPQARFGHDLRILSWDASLDIIKQNWLLGVGEANKIDALVNIYNTKGYVVPAEEKFNSHNQFLDFLIGGGVLGFGLFAFGMIHLTVKSIKDANRALLALVLIFSFAALFENLLDRHAGILFFSTFVSILSIKNH